MAEAGEFLERFSEEERATLAPLRFAAVVGRFYEDLAKRLLEGADEGFEIAGVSVRTSPTSRSRAPTSCRWRRRR